MYILLVVLFLISGQKEIHTSIVDGPTAHKACQDYLPLTIRLYKTGKFHDGPNPETIKKVSGECIPIPRDSLDTEKPAESGPSF